MCFDEPCFVLCGSKNVFGDSRHSVVSSVCEEFQESCFIKCVNEESNISFFFKFIYLFYLLFIFGCVGSSLMCTGSSLVVPSGGYSSLRCVGVSLR